MFRHIRRALPRRSSSTDPHDRYYHRGREVSDGVPEPNLEIKPPMLGSSLGRNDDFGVELGDLRESDKIPVDLSDNDVTAQITSHPDSGPPFELPAGTTMPHTDNPDTGPWTTTNEVFTADTVEQPIAELESIPSSRLVELDSDSRPDTYDGTIPRIAELDSGYLATSSGRDDRRSSTITSDTTSTSSSNSTSPHSSSSSSSEPGGGSGSPSTGTAATAWTSPPPSPSSSSPGHVLGLQTSLDSPYESTNPNSSPTSTTRPYPAPARSTIPSGGMSAVPKSTTQQRYDKSASVPLSFSDDDVSRPSQTPRADESRSDSRASVTSSTSTSISITISVQLDIPFVSSSPVGSSASTSINSCSPPHSPDGPDTDADADISPRQRQSRGRRPARHESVMALLNSVLSSISELFLLSGSRSRCRSRSRSRSRSKSRSRSRARTPERGRGRGRWRSRSRSTSRWRSRSRFRGWGRRRRRRSSG
ncbi:hypothetical protein IAU59_001862 [Kwoniella sp. CBS 9459]